jgi:hypothetical protein
MSDRFTELRGGGRHIVPAGDILIAVRQHRFRNQQRSVWQDDREAQEVIIIPGAGEVEGHFGAVQHPRALLAKDKRAFYVIGHVHLDSTPAQIGAHLVQQSATAVAGARSHPQHVNIPIQPQIR